MKRSLNYRIISIFTVISIFTCILYIPQETEAIPLISITEGCFIEVLLNKDDITYDLDPLEDLVDDGYVNKQGGLIDSLLGNGMDSTFEMDGDPFPFMTLTSSYIYRGHMYNGTAVLVTYTDNSFISELSGEDVDLAGLSVSLMIPTRDETVVITREEALLELNNSIILDDQLKEIFQEMDYHEHYNVTAMLPPIPGGDSVLMVDRYNFTRGNLTFEFILDQPTAITEEMSSSSLNIIGSNISLSGSVEDEVLTLLDLLSIDHVVWNESLRSYITDVRVEPVPDIDMDPGLLDWGAALRCELEILMNYSVIDGLSSEDLDSIEMIGRSGEGIFNDVILYHQDTWNTLGNLIENHLLFLWPLQSIMKETLPVMSFSTTPSTKDDPVRKNRCRMIAIFSISILTPISAALIYTRLKTRSLENNANRKRMIELIESEPGIHFRELCRKLDLKQGVLSYHLNILEKHGIVKSVQNRSHRRFFISGVKVQPSAFLTDLQSSIVDVVMDSPGISKSRISKELGRSRALIGYHVRVLSHAKLLEVRKEEGRTSCFPIDNTPSPA